MSKDYKKAANGYLLDISGRLVPINTQTEALEIWNALPLWRQICLSGLYWMREIYLSFIIHRAFGAFSKWHRKPRRSQER